MAAKNGCNESAKILLAHGASIEAKANVCIFIIRASSGCFCLEIEKLYLLPNLLLLLFFHAEWNDSVAPCCLALTSS